MTICMTPASSPHIPLENIPNSSDNNFMDCPRCKKPLIILEFEKVEVDYCSICRGVWLDSGELELLLGSPNDSPIEFKSDKSSGERPLKCPRCRKRMEKVSSEFESGILLDRCKNEHGLWFDRGELEAILSGKKIGPDNRISEHLKGIFLKQTKSLDIGESK